jgi:WD40 repeat protein
MGRIAISPGGKILAMAGKAHAATLIDLDTLKEVGKLGGQKEIVALAFDKTGETVATASRDGTTIIWDVKKREKLKELDQSHHSGIGTMAYSADGKTVVTTGSFKGNNFLRAWEVDKGEPRWTFENPKTGVQLLNGVRNLALSPDGKMLVFVANGGFVRFISDLDKGADVETSSELSMNDAGGNLVAFSPDGKMIAVGVGRTVKIGDAPVKKKE